MLEPMNRIDSERSDLLDSTFSRKAEGRFGTVDLISGTNAILNMGTMFLCGAHEQNRTVDLILTKDVLCQLSYMGRLFTSSRNATSVASSRLLYPSLLLRLERATGFEPATSSVEGWRSTS